jgi:hypothetical protein
MGSIATLFREIGVEEIELEIKKMQIIFEETYNE